MHSNGLKYYCGRYRRRWSLLCYNWAFHVPLAALDGASLVFSVAQFETLKSSTPVTGLRISSTA